MPSLRHGLALAAFVASGCAIPIDSLVTSVDTARLQPIHAGSVSTGFIGVDADFLPDPSTTKSPDEKPEPGSGTQVTGRRPMREPPPRLGPDPAPNMQHSGNNNEPEKPPLEKRRLTIGHSRGPPLEPSPPTPGRPSPQRLHPDKERGKMIHKKPERRDIGGISGDLNFASSFKVKPDSDEVKPDSYVVKPDSDEVKPKSDDLVTSITQNPALAPGLATQRKTLEAALSPSGNAAASFALRLMDKRNDTGADVNPIEKDRRRFPGGLEDSKIPVSDLNGCDPLLLTDGPSTATKRDCIPHANLNTVIGVSPGDL